MARALEKNLGEITFLGPVRHDLSLLRLANRMVKKLTGKAYNISHSILASKKYASIVDKRLQEDHYDIIISPASGPVLSELKTSLPVVYFTDTTFKSLYNYYEWFSGFTAFSVWEGNRTEKKALRNSDVVVVASQWAYNSVLQDYGIDPEKIFIAPMGANIDHVPPLEKTGKRERGDACRLLFIGMEWKRKGGDIAVETLERLRSMGLNTELTVCGCELPDEYMHLGIRNIPFIDKRKPEDLELFYSLLENHHFLLLPTRAECFGIVFCEASAFGMPSITTDTGGIASAVENGVNGYRLPWKAGGEKYAQKIADIYTSYEHKYLPLSRSSRIKFDETLNWDSWSAVIKNILMDKGILNACFSGAGGDR